MAYCKNCGVELENDMQDCPLCGEPVTANRELDKTDPVRSAIAQNASFSKRKPEQPQQRFTWEIVSIILLSGIMATFIIDYALNRRITWSQYPIAICLTLFCYLSFFAFFNQSTIVVMAGGFVTASFFLLIADLFTGSFNWAINPGILILFAGNVATGVLLTVMQKARYKGINLVAYSFIAAAFFCICIEGILSFSGSYRLQLWWSLIVAACVLPVALVLLFLHFRLQRGRSLHKTFHI